MAGCFASPESGRCPETVWFQSLCCKVLWWIAIALSLPAFLGAKLRKTALVHTQSHSTLMPGTLLPRQALLSLNVSQL